MQLLNIHKYLVVLSILSGCAMIQNSPVIKLGTVSGSVTGHPVQNWPTDTELHVFLKEQTKGTSDMTNRSTSYRNELGHILENTLWRNITLLV